ncbi:MAG: prepilin-type N-terminal cleavage/methylation domain-containing protein [Vicinamibacterales bacterium]
MVTRARGDREHGFTLVELLLALVVSIVVVGGATLLSGQMQGAYRAQMEEAAAQQEGRYVLDQIERYLRSAGNNPYRVETTGCPIAGTAVMAIRLDPDGDGLDDDVRLQADVGPTNGLIGGNGTTCNEPDEDVTIAHDGAGNTVTLTDHNAGGHTRALTDAVVTSLRSSTVTPATRRRRRPTTLRSSRPGSRYCRGRRT